MASTQEFRRRIKSVNNTKQITKAMEMVASVKMQKATKAIVEARAYVQNSWNMLYKLARIALPENHPLFTPKEIGKTAIIFITSNRGLCGAYNADLAKKLAIYIKEEKSDCDVIAIGKKGAEVVKSYNLGNLISVFENMDDIQFKEMTPISTITNGDYLKGKYDKVVMVYSHFVSSLRQVPVVQQILPICDDHVDAPELWEKIENIEYEEYIFEPDAEAILNKLLRRIIRMQIYGAILEANASVQSAQMVAMKNATDNAVDLIDELTLTYNSIRQNSITNEIAEISGAAEAMK